MSGKLVVVSGCWQVTTNTPFHDDVPLGRARVVAAIACGSIRRWGGSNCSAQVSCSPKNPSARSCTPPACSFVRIRAHPLSAARSRPSRLQPSFVASSWWFRPPFVVSHLKSLSPCCPELCTDDYPAARAALFRRWTSLVARDRGRCSSMACAFVVAMTSP